MDVVTMPMTSHGLNLPQRVRVRSIILPIIGSLNASKIRAPTIIAVMAASCAASSLRVKRIYVSMKFVKRLYIISLPTVPSGYIMRFFFLSLSSSSMAFSPFHMYLCGKLQIAFIIPSCARICHRNLKFIAYPC